MDLDVYLSKRIDYDTCIATDKYMYGMLSLLKFLINDLEKFLDKEGRYFGITVKYIHDLRESLKSIEEPVDYVDIGGEIMFLYKPLIIKAYKKYVKRGLSRADSIICISRTICSIILQQHCSPQLLGSYEIYDKLYMNIKNRAKEYTYGPLEEIMTDCMESGMIGTYKSESLSVIEEERKRRSKIPLDGTGVRINKSFDNEVVEVSWTEE